MNNNKEILEKVTNYIWDIESDCIEKAVKANDFGEEIKYNYTADMLSKIRIHIKELI